MRRNVRHSNNVNRIGSGSQTIMFVHGYGCDQVMWRFTTPAFERDYDIILFDHIGSGKSDISYYDFEKYNSLEGYADDVILICEQLNLKDVILVGHSVSAIIGVLAANKLPDLFSNLVLICPSPCYIKNENYDGFTEQDLDGIIDLLESNYLGWTNTITPLISGNDSETTSELKNSFCRMKPEIAKHFAKVAFLGDNRDDLSEVSVPSLIIQCNPDRISPLEVGQFVHNQIKGSCLTVLDEPGHCPHLTAPQKNNNAIKSYLKQNVE